MAQVKAKDWVLAGMNCQANYCLRWPHFEITNVADITWVKVPNSDVSEAWHTECADAKVYAIPQGRDVFVWPESDKTRCLYELAALVASPEETVSRFTVKASEWRKSLPALMALPEPPNLEWIGDARNTEAYKPVTAHCWNGFCIIDNCPGVDHVDAAGDSWTQPRGTVYNPETCEYEPPADANNNTEEAAMTSDPYGREFLRVGNLYPVAEEDQKRLPAGWDHRAARVRATAEKRPPRAGEWYLSGAVIEGYRAPNDLSTAFRIGELVRGEYVTTWREVKQEEGNPVSCGQRWVAEIAKCPHCGLAASNL